MNSNLFPFGFLTFWVGILVGVFSIGIAILVILLSLMMMYFSFGKKNPVAKGRSYQERVSRSTGMKNNKASWDGGIDGYIDDVPTQVSTARIGRGKASQFSNDIKGKGYSHGKIISAGGFTKGALKEMRKHNVDGYQIGEEEI